MYYKYFSFPCRKREKIKRINQLKRNKIWFSTRFGLNDPFDLQMLKIDALSDDVRKYYITASNEKLCLCLTRSPKNTLMWAHYADSFKGFCLGFDYIGKDECEPKKIKYDVSLLEYCSIYTKLFYKIMESNKSLDETITEIHINEPEFYNKAKNLLHNLYYQKTREWKYENEYRILQSFGKSKGKNKYGKLIYLDKIGLYVKEIIIGLNCSDDNFSLLNDLCVFLNLNRNKKQRIKLKVLTIENGRLVLKQMGD